MEYHVKTRSPIEFQITTTYSDVSTAEHCRDAIRYSYLRGILIGMDSDKPSTLKDAMARADAYCYVEEVQE